MDSPLEDQRHRDQSATNTVVANPIHQRQYMCDTLHEPRSNATLMD